MSHSLPPSDSELSEIGRGVAEYMKKQRREDKRDSAVRYTCGILAFLSFCGWVFICLGPLELLFDQWGLGHSLSTGIRIVLCFGLPLFFWMAFFWLSEKTGLHYLVEDWVVSWDICDSDIQKYKNFPRKKRRALIGDLKKELDDVTEQLSRLDDEAYDEEDEDWELSKSVEDFTQVIGGLHMVAESSSRKLIQQPDRTSWKRFVLELEMTYKRLESELAEIEEYDEKVQPIVKQAFQVATTFRTRIEQALLR